MLLCYLLVRLCQRSASSSQREVCFSMRVEQRLDMCLSAIIYSVHYFLCELSLANSYKNGHPCVI